MDVGLLQHLPKPLLSTLVGQNILQEWKAG